MKYYKAIHRVNELYTGDGLEDYYSISNKTSLWCERLLRQLMARDQEMPGLINEVPPGNDEHYADGYDPTSASLLMEWWFGQDDCPYMSLELDPYGIVTILTDPSDGDDPCGTNENMTVLQHRTTAPEETANFFCHCIDKHFSL
jgi:hypothetical protein